MTAAEVQLALKKVSSPAKAQSSARFFKTGPGQYGEGDQFIGGTLPELRKIAQQYRDLQLSEAGKLLQSPIHEERLVALLVLNHQYKTGDGKVRQQVTDLYLANTRYVNNWDLVDSSAEYIVGPTATPELLAKLAKSEDLWERRIAIVATFYFIKRGQHQETFRVAELLLNDQHDLIHKAVGWMLREVGKKCGREVLVGFLARHYQTMPRTALRYAIEHFEPERRQAYLKGQV